jgi:5-methylcytosine-specific restriction endonuclease McrA
VAKKRLEILNRDNFKCCLCDGEEVELHVHHLKVHQRTSQCSNKDLETLCKYCHNLNFSKFQIMEF